MSVEALSWAFQQDVQPAAKKLVLLALANRADEDGCCYPGYNRLASQCSLDRRTVIRQIDALIEDGLILKKDRVRENGSTTSNMYQIMLKGGCQDATPPGVRMPPPGCQDATPIYEHLYNKQKNSPLSREEFLREIDRERIAGRFENFNAPESVINIEAGNCFDYWAAYPEKKPTGDMVAGFIGWLRQSKAIATVQKLAEQTKRAAEGVKAAEPSNPLQDWHKAIAQRVPEGIFRAWFRPMVLVGSECRAPTRFHADFVKQHHGKEFNAVLPGVKITVQPATARQE